MIWNQHTEGFDWQRVIYPTCHKGLYEAESPIAEHPELILVLVEP